jgi:hypothetical protein
MGGASSGRMVNTGAVAATTIATIYLLTQVGGRFGAEAGVEMTDGISHSFDDTRWEIGELPPLADDWEGGWRATSRFPS